MARFHTFGGVIAVIAGLIPNLAAAQGTGPGDSCKALLSPDNRAAFETIRHAPTNILSAVVVPAGGDQSIVQRDLPEYCRVEGMIAPTVGFLLRMPTKTWNGKFMMGGCGGPCGNYLEDRIDPALVRNYAVVTTDMGHKGGSRMYGYNNLPNLIDDGFRSTHVTAVAAKVIIAAHYGRKAEFNYYMGCSTGGRQGLQEAQRFPFDFDGIIAGAPPHAQINFQPLIDEWVGRNNVDADGKLILTKDKLPLIHNAVLAACDEIDGLKDGVLQHPPACKWQPSELLCKGRARADCLTAAQVEVAEKAYRGATWSDGSPMFYGQSGRARGTELKWASNLEPSTGRGVNSSLKYMDVFAAPGPEFADAAFDIDRDVPESQATEMFYYHRNPDLRQFKAAGGKLILFNGWDDDCCRADATIEYYEMVTRLMGGPERTMDFARLFLPAGMDHCRYGIGGGEVDWITALENWVEKGQAPEQVIAHHMIEEPYPSVPRHITDYGSPYTRMARHPLPPESYDRAHPVYPYPDWPRYAGQGDPADPANWRRVTGEWRGPE
ncbi:MAG: tannase/feruloyl esterase family alpha/beta hydrolase [Rhodospirillaceae bacterium]|nr:tannase/feruloyl esterase family alpha/beta hydrolase [Rhodospirillaceae bacterium]